MAKEDPNNTAPVNVTEDYSVTDSIYAKKLDKYSVGKYKYPEDVGVSLDLQHYMVFYINARAKSDGKKPANSLFRVYDNPMLTSDGVTTAIEQAGVLATGGAIASSLSLGSINRKIAKGQSASKAFGTEILGAVGKNAGVAATSAGLAAASAMTTQTTTYRLKDAIVMAVQEAPKVHYRANYDTFDAGTLMGAASANASSILGGLTNSSMLTAGAIKALSIPTAAGAPDFGKGIQKAMGQSINPFRTALFQNVDLRTFSYNYKFMPKSKKEAENVRNIINTFKAHMHPEFSFDKVFLIHPSEFNIVYYYKQNENPMWHKISTCVLTEMELDAGAEQLATFEDGMSVEINMKLSFMETEMLTREKVEQGY